MQLINNSKVRTRKEHQCIGCGKKISKNRTAITSTVAEDGRVYTTYICGGCNIYVLKHSREFSDGFREGELRIGREEDIRSYKHYKKIKVERAKEE